MRRSWRAFAAPRAPLRTLLALDRSLIGSDAVIAAAIALHAIQGATFLWTAAANGAIAMNALLCAAQALGGGRHLAGALLLLTCLLALIGQWGRRVRSWRRLLLLMPQETLLLIAAAAAVVAIALGHYADGVARHPLFIFCDQLQLIAAPCVYAAAMFARIGGGRG